MKTETGAENGEGKMKTIYVKDVVQRVVRPERWDWQKTIPTLVFLCAMFFLGRSAAEVIGEMQLTSAPAVVESENWGLGFGGEGQKPTGNATAAELKKYNTYFCGEGEEKVIYLTFDCGYENGNTEPILDALKKHNAPATFFVVGHFLESAPEIVKRMVEDNHTVGNHTYHHPDMSKISDKASFQKEMDDVASLFKETTGTELAMYYRPPQGKYSTANLQMAKELGYSTFFWSLAYVDWNQDDQPSHEEAFEKLTKRIHPGAIVLLHSTSKTNGEIMDELLTKWEEMGYTFRPLSDLVEGGNEGGNQAVSGENGNTGHQENGNQENTAEEKNTGSEGRILQDGN